MVVNCLACDARYGVSDERISDRGVKIDCPRCAYTFVVFRDSDVPTPTSATREAIERISFMDSGVRWEVQAVDGSLIPFSNLATLRILTQRGTVATTAGLRFNEGTFVPLGELVNLEAYFWDVFERARNGHLSNAAPMMTPIEGSVALTSEGAPPSRTSPDVIADSEVTAIDLDPRMAANTLAKPSASQSSSTGELTMASDTSTDALPEPLGWEANTSPWVLPNERTPSENASDLHLPVESTTGSVVVLRASQNTLAGKTSMEPSRMVLTTVGAALLTLALALAITLPFALQQIAGGAAPSPVTIAAPPAPRINQNLSSGVVVERPEATADATAAPRATPEVQASSEGVGSASEPPAKRVQRVAPSPKAAAPKRTATAPKVEPQNGLKKAPSTTAVEPAPAPPVEPRSKSTSDTAPDPFSKTTTDLRDPFAN